MSTEANLIHPSERLRAEAESWRRHGRRPPGIQRPGPGQESVWDYPRPPAVVACEHLVVVEAGGLQIARTRGALRVLETASPPTFYLPPGDVRTDLLRPEDGSSMCEWKGAARYWALRFGDYRSSTVAWSYPNPFDEYEVLRGYLAFYPGRVDRCTVGGNLVTPQPGRFYGGWITPELVGPFKGEPGSEGW